MKTLLKVAAMCLGLFFATPSFSQIRVEVGHHHHLGRYIVYGPDRYHVWMHRGVIYRDESGPAIRFEKRVGYFRDVNGNTYHYENGVRVFD